MELTSNFEQYIPYLIIILTAISSIIGFNNFTFFERNKFNVGAIIVHKQWDRMLTSAFLHADWMHLVFNMYTLYAFSDVIITYTGAWQYLCIYFAAILAGNFLSLWMHTTHYQYSAIGASGGVFGILFAAIALIPTVELNIMFIPIGIPAWVLGLIYLSYSLYAMKQRNDNIGHDAHLGGAVAGLALVAIFLPEVVIHNWIYFLILCAPICYLAYQVWQEKR